MTTVATTATTSTTTSTATSGSRQFTHRFFGFVLGVHGRDDHRDVHGHDVLGHGDVQQPSIHVSFLRLRLGRLRRSQGHGVHGRDDPRGDHGHDDHHDHHGNVQQPSNHASFHLEQKQPL
ncbi:hypothetical protein LEN26_014660 [Aphanomyces euteiches]|nr:hypothetical protein LEN26_014660 [Aphanomyces euteiches]KAH9121561.1 hypothetical protein AeMF1_006779 [Aphanomyces euteiches]